MRTYTKRNELKKQLKDKALLIRGLKKEIAENHQTGNSDLASRQQSELHYRKLEYRWMHIAYSMLRGKTIEQIEPRRKQSTPEPDMFRIGKIMAEFTDIQIPAETEGAK